MNTKHPFYGFTPERHTEVDAQLARIGSELMAILEEYRRITAPTNQHGFTALTIEQTVNSVHQVQAALQEEQTHRRKRP